MPQKNNTNKAMSDPDDQDVFRTAMQDVVPLPASNKADIKHPKPKPRPLRNHFPAGEMEQSKDIFLDIEADGEWSFLRPGVSRQTLRRLRNGYWTVQDSLDLHGLTQDVARQQLVLFLENAAQSRYRCVRVVHGKGLSSADGIPVLKHRIGSWLVQYSAVLAFCQTKPEDGGGGAVMVLLKK
jgi:DNA-nicking Smr family endonuclease